MATLRARLNRLEGKRGTSLDQPGIIYLCGVGAVDGEATGARTAAAWVKVGTRHDYLIREDGETEEAFAARAEALSGA